MSTFPLVHCSFRGIRRPISTAVGADTRFSTTGWAPRASARPSSGPAKQIFARGNPCGGELTAGTPSTEEGAVKFGGIPSGQARC